MNGKQVTSPHLKLHEIFATLVFLQRICSTKINYACVWNHHAWTTDHTTATLPDI